jgi:hypothetical protein
MLIGHFSKAALATIGELEYLFDRLTKHPDVGPGGFRNRAAQMNALNVLLKYQGRANRYRAVQWQEYRRVAEPAAKNGDYACAKSSRPESIHRYLTGGSN